MSQLAIELRPGEGGDDAFAFCRELKSAILAYARSRGDTAQSAESRPGSRTLVVVVAGDRRAYEKLAGVHRVQRIPKTDRQGRRHTSTATLAVLAQRPQRTVEVADEDVDVFTYRGHGKGGQHRNKTDSAVRLVHRPTQTTAVVEHGRSQWQNLQEARAVLAQRLEEVARQADSAKVLSERNRQIASGERPVKQFTHNEQRSVVESHGTGEIWRWPDFYRGRIDRQDAARRRQSR
jgi:peptide chain release factor 1